MSTAASTMAGSASKACSGATSTPKIQATPKKTTICSTDKLVPASSLKASNQARFKGAVSSKRINPISRS